MFTLKKTLRLSIIPAVALLTLFSIAFVPANTDADNATIEITGTDNMKFDVTSIEAEAGETITIEFTTKSKIPKEAMAHNVVVLDKDTDVQAFINASAKAKDNAYVAPDFEDQVIAATDLAGGGETVEVTFTVPDEPGDYEYVCSFPGHYAGGMKGILTVK